MLRVDSRKVMPGDTFIALRSNVRDGHDFIDDALERGAVCIIAEKGEYDVKTIIVPNTRVYLANYLKEMHADKLKDVKFIGFAGTNGKTISSFFMYQMLTNMGIKAAYIGNFEFYLPSKKRNIDLKSLDLYDLYDLFVESAMDDCKYIVLEISSYSLIKKCFDGIRFDVLCFTNFVSDNLGAFGIEEEYKKSLINLFSHSKGYCIINNDDSFGKKIECKKKITIGLKKSDYVISDIVYDKTHSTFKITSNGEGNYVTLSILGLYNIYNYLYSYVVLDRLDFDLSSIIEASLNITTPNGHYQVINGEKNIAIIDYANTPSSVLNIIRSVRDYAMGRIVCVIGCSGDKNKEKRSIIGTVVSSNCDYVYFTSDNPRNESPEDILNDITMNIKIDNYVCIVDRSEAIKKACDNLEENDILLVLGKGNENYQILGNDKFPYSDISEITKHLK